MAISHEKKEELVALYKEKIEQSSAIIFTDYRGISVPEVQDLRFKLSESDTIYMVVKNRLFAIALEQLERPKPQEFLEGPSGLAFVGEDIGRGVTALSDWIKDDSQDHLSIKGGLLDQSILDESGINALTKLPTKEQMQATLLTTLQGTGNSMVRMLNGSAETMVRMLEAPVREVVLLLEARIQQLKDEAA